MSTSVLPGETALFMCAGNGDILLWAVNGQLHHVPASKERGVQVMYDNINFPVLKSNLTIPGTMENENVSIQCIIGCASDIVYSPVVFLIVLGKLCMAKK